MNNFSLKNTAIFCAFAILTIASFYLALKPAEVVNIPDAAFKKMLLENIRLNKNRDSEIQVSEAIAYKAAIRCTIPEVKSLVGIERFANLTHLLFDNTGVTFVDLSKNLKLEYISFENVNLSVIDLSQNTKLKLISCDGSSLKYIDLSKNTDLETFLGYGSQIASLDFSNNLKLSAIFIGGESLKSLDIINNENLVTLLGNSCTGLTNVIKNAANERRLIEGRIPKVTKSSK